MEAFTLAVVALALVALAGFVVWASLMKVREMRTLADSLFTQERAVWKENLDRREAEVKERLKDANERMKLANEIILKIQTHPSQTGLTQEKATTLVRQIMNDMFNMPVPRAAGAPPMQPKVPGVMGVPDNPMGVKPNVFAEQKRKTNVG